MKVSVTIDKTAASVLIEGLPKIEFVTSDLELTQNNNFDFALWALLPIAMRKNQEVKCDFSVSREAYESALKVAKIWARWCPEIFTVPRIDVTISDTKSENNLRELLFFSGGIDSTFSALKLNEEGKNVDCLTVHGMDYKYDDIDKFDALMRQTEKFRNRYFQNSISVRTNIYRVYNTVGCNPRDGYIIHIFALFASGSLFRNYGRYYIAADCRFDQEYSVHPYGSNSATNRLMANENGTLVTRDDDISRAEKTLILANSGIDLASLSICVNYKVRPFNCGICSKCIRTKVMFYANTGVIPDIFRNREIPKDWYQTINVRRKAESMSMANCLDAIEASNHKDELNYKSAFLYWKTEASNARANPFYALNFKSVMKYFLPTFVIQLFKKVKN